ncbi:ribonuclease E [Murinocardiopsis flavida]|uniref:Ribonuclease E n=1 Tax=Murinocardiopsis flavida TaxID=645275 RepID=A0A2P8DU76_9ACTN|nr:Rne/Rng family ribonuclease [Murinocardiopsis flavida]PSL00776.1 ribonuclease E [Murinocardiopsis flavida]
MLENEPSSGAEGTAGTTTDEETDRTANATTAVPQSEDVQVQVSAPGKGRGARRAAGPPPEPEPAPAAPTTVAAGTDSAVIEDVAAEEAGQAPAEEEAPAPAAKRTRAKTTRTRRTKAAAAAPEEPAPVAPVPAENAAPEAGDPFAEEAVRLDDAEDPELAEDAEDADQLSFRPAMVLFQPPVAPARAESKRVARVVEEAAPAPAEAEAEAAESDDDDDDDDDRPSRRRRRRGGRGRGKLRGDEGGAETSGGSGRDSADGGADGSTESAGRDGGSGGSAADDSDDNGDDSASSRRRRRRRRRASGDDDGGGGTDDPPNTVVRVREPRPERPIEDEVQSVRGSTRLEAKKQRRREGREQGRRRAPIITESEFLARREAVKRDLVIRRNGERTQIAVLEDDVLVEHYVDRASHKSYVGNVYLGRVQNVLPSMEAAFVDIGKGRNAVLYAGEVNWDASGLEGQPKRIESALKSGQSVLVQVTKDPLGHKGARLTSQISLPGRYLVYVPEGSMTGISRKLPDKERARLKQILKKVMPENAGVIVRTASEGASEEELERDITRLAKQWESIKKKSKTASAPSLLNSEPDLTIRVVRDVFNEDFSSMVVAGEEAQATVEEYVDYVAPNLAERLKKYDGERDVFEAYRIDEQIAKALDRKVWLPSGGSLVIDRTEAMTVVDVNTGKFTGQGGNLEETVTKNNLEAAEEIVRQLRLRDIGGIIVIDFIDMVLESNRDLVLRRLLECLSRDRTKHQVAEVTSLGLVQMTRKRVGQGLLEAFSHTCETCNGRGLMISTEPVEAKGSGNGNGGGGQSGQQSSGGGRKKKGKSQDKPAKDDAAADEQVREPAEAAPEPEAEPEAPAAEAPAKKPRKSPRRSRKDDAKGAEKDAPEAEAPAAAVDTAPAEVAAEPEAERPRRRRTRRTKAASAASEAAAEAG